MFIETEATPNPNTLKFLPGRTVMAQGTASYTNVEAAAHSPLARRLFAVGGVSGVFFGSDFVTVAKEDAVDWAVVKPRVLSAVMDHYSTGDIAPEAEPAAAPAEDGDRVSTQIRELLDTRIRPMVANDGGDIIFRGFEDGIVYLHMQGSCAGCPSSTATLKHGVENMLRYYIPEVQSVEAVD